MLGRGARYDGRRRGSQTDAGCRAWQRFVATHPKTSSLRSTGTNPGVHEPMYPGTHAASTPDKPAIVMAATGATTTYRELGNELPAGETGLVYFALETPPFEYHGDEEQTTTGISTSPIVRRS